MRAYTDITLRKKFHLVSLFTMIILFLSGIVLGNASAQSAETIMDNVLDIMDNVLEGYEYIEDYAATVHTYEADSMEVSGSIFEGQPPRVAFSLFFRQPDEHAVEEIGNSGRGVFRVELLSALGHLRPLEMQPQGRAFLLGDECHLIEFTDPDKPEDKAHLWVSPKNWRVLQLTFFIKSIELVRTQFRYDPGNPDRLLPIETRTFFPVSKRILINRIMNYEVNTGLPPEIFDLHR